MKRSPGDKSSKPSKVTLTPAPRYRFRLFVTGSSPNSVRAIRNLSALCERRFPGHYDLDVVDIFQHPEHIKTEQIVVTPTLVRLVPAPARRVFGDLSNSRRVLAALDLDSPDSSEDEHAD